MPVLMISPFSLYVTFFFDFSAELSGLFALTLPHIRQSESSESKNVFMVYGLHVSWFGLFEVFYNRLEFFVQLLVLQKLDVRNPSSPSFNIIVEIII